MSQKQQNQGLTAEVGLRFGLLPAQSVFGLRQNSPFQTFQRRIFPDKNRADIPLFFFKILVYTFGERGRDFFIFQPSEII